MPERKAAAALAPGRKAPAAPPPGLRRAPPAPRTTRRAARSPPPRARLSRAEEADQRLDDATIGVHRDLVDRQSAQQSAAVRELFLDGGGELGTHRGIAGVDVECGARLGIDEPCEPDVGKRLFARIVHGD